MTKNNIALTAYYDRETVCYKCILHIYCKTTKQYAEQSNNIYLKTRFQNKYKQHTVTK